MAQEKTQFKPGQSGNPKGRPPGRKGRNTAIRELLDPHKKDLVEKAVALAMAGDTTALRLCLERLYPPIKATDDPVHIGKLSGSLAAQGQQILSAMGSGALTPSQATTMLQAIAAQSRIIETDELEQRVKKLEDGC